MKSDVVSHSQGSTMRGRPHIRLESCTQKVQCEHNIVSERKRQSKVSLVAFHSAAKLREGSSSSDELAEISVRLLELPSPQLKENFDPSVLDTHGRSPKPVAVLGRECQKTTEEAVQREQEKREKVDRFHEKSLARVHQRKLDEALAAKRLADERAARKAYRQQRLAAIQYPNPNTRARAQRSVSPAKPSPKSQTPLPAERFRVTNRTFPFQDARELSFLTNAQGEVVPSEEQPSETEETIPPPPTSYPALEEEYFQAENARASLMSHCRGISFPKRGVRNGPLQPVDSPSTDRPTPEEARRNAEMLRYVQALRKELGKAIREKGVTFPPFCSCGAMSVDRVLDLYGAIYSRTEPLTTGVRGSGTQPFTPHKNYRKAQTAIFSRSPPPPPGSLCASTSAAACAGPRAVNSSWSDPASSPKVSVLTQGARVSATCSGGAESVTQPHQHAVLSASGFKDHANSSSTSAADSILGFRTDAWKGCANNCVFYHNPADYIALCENILKSKNL